MPENARHIAAVFDQFEDEHQIADWGGDDLFTRMPRPRPVDDAPAPRFRPSLVASESSESAPRRFEQSAPPPERAAAARRRFERSAPPPDSAAATAGRALALVEPPADAPVERPAHPGERAMRGRAERRGLSVVEPAHRFDEAGALIEPAPTGRTTKVITGHPGEAPRPLPTVRGERRRAPRSPAEWIGPRPERIVAWAFALGLILILIAISTADAATL
jgi:hypothetical protein